MGFFGLVIANNLSEIIIGLCVVVVIGGLGIKLGRWLERRKIKKQGDIGRVL